MHHQLRTAPVAQPSPDLDRFKSDQPDGNLATQVPWQICSANCTSPGSAAGFESRHRVTLRSCAYNGLSGRGTDRTLDCDRERTEHLASPGNGESRGGHRDRCRCCHGVAFDK